jgi:hypothetical protein
MALTPGGDCPPGGIAFLMGVLSFSQWDCELCSNASSALLSD